MSGETIPDVRIRQLTQEEGFELLDRAARYYLDMSGDEFVRAWYEGKFDDNPDDPDVVEVAMMLPLVVGEAV